MLNTIPLKKQDNISEFEKSNLLQQNHNKDEEMVKLIHTNFNKNIVGNHNTIPIDNHNTIPIDNTINPIINTNNKTMISFSESLKKFVIYNENKNPIGFFTLEHIVKYLGNIYDTERQFMTDIDMETFKKSKQLIKLFLFKIDYCKKNKKSDIIIHDYTTSGLMGDVSLLIKLNNLLYLYQEHNLSNDLAHVDDNNKIKIEQNIKKFMYLLLIYTLKLCVIITEKIKDKDEKLKSAIISYAITCSNRINLFVQEQLGVIYILDRELKKAYNTNMDIKIMLKKQLETITKEIVESCKSGNGILKSDKGILKNDKEIVNGHDAFKL